MRGFGARRQYDEGCGGANMRTRAIGSVLILRKGCVSTTFGTKSLKEAYFQGLEDA
jgi:hypothetical protein